MSTSDNKTGVPEPEKMWTIELTEAQVHEIRTALELKVRIMAGQFEDLGHLLRNNPVRLRPNRGNSMDYELLPRINPETLHHALKLLRATAFPELEPNASYGVGRSAETDRLWDMMVMLRNTVARSKPVTAENQYLVDRDPPELRLFSDWAPIKVTPK